MNDNEEIERLRKIITELTAKHAALLFAFIKVVDTGNAVPFPDDTTRPLSMDDALENVRRINEWRQTNQLNIKAVDI